MNKNRSVSVTRLIKAPAETIFAVIDNPAKHPAFDGSGTVKAARVTDRDMKLGIPYRMTSKVVEYEANRLLAWAHFGGHRWRYRLEPVDEANTMVTETFDWSTSRSPWFIERAGYPKRHPPNMARTLDRLATLVEQTP